MKKRLSLFALTFLLMTISFSFGVLGQCAYTCCSDEDCGGSYWEHDAPQGCQNTNDFNYSTYDDWIINTCIDPDTEGSYCDMPYQEARTYSECAEGYSGINKTLSGLFGFCTSTPDIQCVDFQYVILDGLYAPINAGNYSSDFDIINFSSAFPLGYSLDLHSCGWNATCSYSVNGVMGTTQFLDYCGSATTCFQPVFENIQYKYGNNTMKVWCNASLNSSEADCSLVTSSSGEYTSTFWYEGEFNLTITSILPINETQIGNNLFNFTANVSCGLECDNATLNFANSSGIVYNISTDLTGINDTILSTEVNLSNYLGDGNYVWYYEIRDIYNHLNTTSERTISLDITPPFITWINPSTFISTFDENYTLNISISNILLNIVNVTIFNSSGDLIYTNLSQNINSPTFQIDDTIPLDLGNNLVGIYAIDNATNSAYETKTIQRNETIIIPVEIDPFIQGGGIIYELLRSIGAGLGLLFNYIVATLPTLIIDLILIVIILVIAWGVYGIIIHFITHVKGGK
jgi:hypothetical protein